MHSLPSPANSPSLKSVDLLPQQSRKRQRTLSMQSDTSSASAKRTIPDGSSHNVTRSPRADDNSTVPLADINHGIDSYMAEQGDQDVPAVFRPESPTSQGVTGGPTLSPTEKYAFVTGNKGRKMEVGDTWFLVSRDWWKRWEKACTGQVDKEGPVSEVDLGPVDNSRLLDAFGNLHNSLAEGVDVEYVPDDVWSSLVSWYGDPIHPLPRRVIARGATKQATLELRPPRFKVLKLTKEDTSNQSTDGASNPWVVVSSGETISTLCTRLAAVFAPGRKAHTPYRIWKLESDYDDWSVAEFPSSNLFSFGGKIIEESDKTIEEAGMETADAFVVEIKQPEGWIVDAPKAVPKSSNTPPPLFNSKDGFFNKLGSSFSSPTTAVVKSSNNFYSSLSSSGSKSTSVTLPSGNRNMKCLDPGTLGLGNMGNTCFMNSALQCLAHTKELTEYFQTGVYQDELNPDNPLGMHGAIAEAFGALLERIWASSGNSTSYSPREFKSQLQRFAPQFSGYQQHDSQELVAFLLDGLHEDLNRVLKKPYVEKPDWEGGGNLELIQLAKKSWEGYMMRNDSVIVDLFQGQYQSTLVCPECNKVSITFDPFMYLTLPLPVHKKWKHSIYYVPWDPEKPHVKVPVELNRDASFRDLRNLLGKWMSAPPDNLLTMEIFNHRFYKSLDDTLPCGEMSDNDTLVCFELPCHAQQSRSYKPQPDDPMILPVFLCDAKPTVRSSYISNRNPVLFGYPTVVVIDREQATNINSMYDAVVARLQRWTENARDLYTWEPGPESPMTEVPIRLNAYSAVDTITEISENGDVVTFETPQEADIVDEKDMVVDDDPYNSSDALRLVGTKQDVFTLRLQPNHKEFGTSYNSFASTNKWESWENRIEDSPDHVLLREGDAFYCEFDENMKAYYFGDDTSHWEHARWDTWENFIHPEYEEGQKNAAQKKTKGISLQDCLDEFTKEEKLGEDDLWYCPRCKKHQQATKRFDLWKVPDILVVHLKRFSNNRSLRDKIDTFVDFPVEGLDLGNMVGERAVAKKLLEEGVNIEELKLGSLDEPLLYDLFGVDEHMGGLGGGHYRAYASNHLTGKWYHFDDSFVTSARASDAVNANAYLLFYRRRSNSPLGGKTYEKIQETRQKQTIQTDPVDKSPMTIDTQLPTPPNESNDSSSETENLNKLPSQLRSTSRWKMRSNMSNAGSSVSSPPPDDPPDFEESQSDLLITDTLDPLLISNQNYDFPDPSSNRPSPSSSNEAEADPEEPEEIIWDRARFSVGVREVPADGSPEWGAVSTMASPSSTMSDTNPFSDVNVQHAEEHDETDSTSVHDKTV